MEKALQDFFANHTEAKVIQTFLYGARNHLEILARERNILKQTVPVDETRLQLNTDIANFAQETIKHYENKLEKLLAENK